MLTGDPFPIENDPHQPDFLTPKRTVMKRPGLIFRQALLLVMLCLGGHLLAQPPGMVTPIVTMNGYSLQKSVSLNSVKTNDPFSYTVTFSVPAGATSVVISDNVPLPLVIDNVIVPGAGYAGNIPTVTVTGNLVQLNFASVTGTIAGGSFQINVHFPVDKSCNGLQVYNGASMVGKTPVCELVTERLLTTAVVNNPWRIQKYPTAPWVSPCPYGNFTDTVEYNIRIVKQWWTLSGSASLYTVSLFDILPAGATVIPSTYSSSANMSPSSISPAGVISLPPGFVLDATGNNIYTAKFKVAFAPLLNTCTINTGVLQGKYNCNGTPSPLYSDTSRVGIARDTPVPNGVLSKWYQVSGNSPGCTGTYYVRVCNTGFAPMSPYVLQDNFPNTCVTGVTPTAPAGCTITGGPAVYTLSGPSLAPGQCHTYSFSFTIGTGCPSPIVNTVSVVSGFTSPPRSASIYLLPNDATPCLTKSVCGPTSYTIGSLVRFRLRVQNIGGTHIIGGVITDNIDNGNLQYVGNELYYTYPNPFAPCAPNNTTPPAGATLWTGVTPLHNTATGQLKWNLDTIRADCGTVVYPACGFAYGMKAYYIEFTVKIRDTAGLGNVLNNATIAGGNILTPVTGSATIVINGNLNYTIAKQVSADGGTSFANSVNAAANSLVQYKLMATNAGIPLVKPLIVDLLPRDNVGGTPYVDNLIMASINRGSQYDIRYNSLISSSHTIAPSGQSYSAVDGITTFAELGYTVNGNGPGWVLAPPANTVDIKTSFSQSIGVAPPFAYVFDARTSASAVDGQTACNTFVMRPSAKYLFNYNPYYVLQPSSPDCNTACVTIVKPPCCDPYDFNIPKEICAGAPTQFCAIDSCKEGSIEYYWKFGDGTPVQTGNCVTHTYTAPGTYTITLYWKNDCGESKKEFTITVKECCCDPYAFVVPRTMCVGLPETFCAKDTCKEGSNIYYWKFDDGTTIAGACVTHAFSTPGTHTVWVIWKNECGEHIKEFQVEVKDCPCDINVVYNVSTSGLTIVADASGTTSSLPIALYIWDFGDGTYGTGVTATHTYASPGVYIVRLTVHALDQNGDVCKCVKDCKAEVKVDYNTEAYYSCGESQFGNPKQAMNRLNSSNIILKAAPNPFTDKLTVSIDFINKAQAGDAAGYRLELANSNGTVLQSNPLGGFGKNPVFYTGGYLPGTYIVMLKNKAGQIQSLKVVKLQ